LSAVLDWLFNIFAVTFHIWRPSPLSGSQGHAAHFPPHHRVQTGSEAHPASYPMVPGALSLGIKRPGREADHHPPPFSAEVNECVALYLHPNKSSWRGA
jgi:hypothetical protein